MRHIDGEHGVLASATELRDSSHSSTSAWHPPLDCGGQCAMITDAPSCRLSWTSIGLRMGYTRSPAQRDEIVAAIDGMTWTKSDEVFCVAGPAVRAIVAAVVTHRPDQIELVSVAALNGPRKLIGLETADGTRRFLLDLDAEAIYVVAGSRGHVPAHTRCDVRCHIGEHAGHR